MDKQLNNIEPILPQTDQDQTDIITLSTTQTNLIFLRPTFVHTYVVSLSLLNKIAVMTKQLWKVFFRILLQNLNVIIALSIRIVALLFVSGIMTWCDFSFWGKSPPDKACGLNERNICSKPKTSCGVSVIRQMNIIAFMVVFRCQRCSRITRRSVNSQSSLSGKRQHQHHGEPHHSGRVLSQCEE